LRARRSSWIDAGLHATEVANTPAFDRDALSDGHARRPGDTEDPRRGGSCLAAFSNPDGLERSPTGTTVNANRRAGAWPICRCSTRSTSATTTTANRCSTACPNRNRIARVCYREWFPQVVFNQHQSGPAGAVLFVGAMRDPSNPYLDPLMAPSMETRECACTRVRVGGKARRGGAVGGKLPELVERRRAQHGVLPQRDRHPLGDHRQSDAHRDHLRAEELIMSNDNPYPVEPQPWHFRRRSSTCCRRTAPSSRWRPSIGRASSTTSTGWAGTRSTRAAATGGR